MAAPTRYAAFISYSSLDAAIARRLHRDLEAYRIPPSVGAFQLTDAPNSKNRLFPCFRDREELGSGHLGQAIENALRDCSALIVICSRNSAKSQWVDKEIRYFAETLGRRDRIFAIIVDGEPNARDATAECFPPALRRASIGDAEVVAGDARRTAEGYRPAFLKVVAGIVRVNLGRLTDRDRAARRLRAMTAMGGVAALVLGVTGTIATVDRVQARTAFREAAARIAEDNPTESARFLLAATRAGSELIPSAAGAEASFAAQVYGAVAVDALPMLGDWAASPDGARVVTWGFVSPERGRAEAQLLDASTGAVVQQFELHHAQFSPDSFSFAGWSSAEAASLYNSSSGALITDLGAAREVVFAQDGRTVLTIPGGALYDAHTGVVLGRFGDGYLLESSATTAREHIAMEDVDRTWLVIEARTGRRVAALPGARQLVLAPVGARTLTADRDMPILDPFQPMETFLQQQFPVVTLRNADGRAIATLGETFEFAFSGDGARVAGRMSGIKLWEAASGRLIADFPDFHQYALSPDGSRMVAYSNSSGALIDTANGRVVGDIAEMRPSDFLNTEWLNPMGAATFSPDGRYFTVTAGQGSGLYASQTGERLGDAKGRIFSPDGQWLFDGTFYAVPSSNLAFRLPQDEALEREAMFTQDSTALFTSVVIQLAAIRLNEPLDGGVGATRRTQACRVNREAIGAFDMFQRDATLADNGAVARNLRGRPWHACDWRGALSPAGWAQTLRYWAVKLGADWDYAEDECTRPRRGFGCPG